MPHDSINWPKTSDEAHRAARTAALLTLYAQVTEDANRRERAASRLLALDGSPRALSPQACRECRNIDGCGITAAQHYTASVGLHLFAADLAAWLEETSRP